MRKLLGKGPFTFLLAAIVITTIVAIGYYKSIKPEKKVTTEAVTTAEPVADSALHYKLDSFFRAKSIEHGFSGSVLVAQKGKVVYEACFGYCDYHAKNMLADTNAFQLASVSKTITATALLKCVEKKLLLLSDTLQFFFPGFPYKNITVEQLLCHRSGLPNYIYFCSKKCKKGTYLSNEDVLSEMVLSAPAAYSAPDKKFEYCNTNYALLALLIERVTQRSFSQFLKQEIFDPLGMKHSFVYDPSDTLKRNIAISHNSKWEIQHDDCFDGVQGDKGIYSTAHDLLLFDRALYEGKLLSPGMLAEAYKPRSFEKPGKRNYGYGWRLIQQPDSSFLVYHNGWWHGNNTVFCRNVRDSSAVIILSNKYNRWVYQTQPVWNILYGLQSDLEMLTEEP